MASPTRILENKRAHKRSKFTKARNRASRKAAKKGSATLSTIARLKKSLSK